MKISVIVPAYDAERYLPETVQSVQAQTKGNWEMIVVNDGSRDDTGPLADRMAAEDPRIRVVHQKNAGLSGARNGGIAAASPAADAFLFLDADDLLEPNALAALATLLEASPDVSAAYGLARYIDAKGQPILPGIAEAFGRSRRSVAGKRLVCHPVEDATRFAMLAYRNSILTPGQVLLRRSALERAGLFDTALPPTADWDMWLRLTRHADMALLDTVTLAYRRHGENMSGKDEVMRPAELTLRAKLCRDETLPPALRQSAIAGYRCSERGWAAQWATLARENLAQGNPVLAVKMLRRALLFYVWSFSGPRPTENN